MEPYSDIEGDRLNHNLRGESHTDIPQTPATRDADRNPRFGILRDYGTAEAIRPATEEELRESLRAARQYGGAGAFDVGGRTCYVQGGPDDLLPAPDEG